MNPWMISLVSFVVAAAVSSIVTLRLMQRLHSAPRRPARFIMTVTDAQPGMWTAATWSIRDCGQMWSTNHSSYAADGCKRPAGHTGDHAFIPPF